MRKIKSVLSLALCACSAAALAGTLAGCAPKASTSDEGIQGIEIVENDTITKGSYDSYDPNAEAENSGGKSIEGSEEEKLQQERIAGGAVGEVTSKNLEHVPGIVDGSEGEYIANYGISLQAPAMGHAIDNRNCLSCHEGYKSSVPMPQSHIDAKIGNETCNDCHAE